MAMIDTIADWVKRSRLGRFLELDHSPSLAVIGECECRSCRELQRSALETFANRIGLERIVNEDGSEESDADFRARLMSEVFPYNGIVPDRSFLPHEQCSGCRVDRARNIHCACGPDERKC